MKSNGGSISQDVITELLHILTRLLEAYFTDRKRLMQWFRSPNKELGYYTPIEVIRSGNGNRVVQQVRRDFAHFPQKANLLPPHQSAD